MALEQIAAADTPRGRHNPWTRSPVGIAGSGFLLAMIACCLLSLPWTMGRVPNPDDPTVMGPPRFSAGQADMGRLSPSWWPPDAEEILRLNTFVPEATIDSIAARHGLTPRQVLGTTSGPVLADLRPHWPRFFLGTDVLGRSLLIRVLTGGGISLVIGIAAALLSVFIGTMYGAFSAYVGGTTDAVMMRIVDILYGLPYILLVVLLAVASDAALDNYISRHSDRVAHVQRQARAHLLALEPPPGLSPTRIDVRNLLDAEPELRQQWQEEAAELFAPRQISEGRRMFFDVLVLLVAIGGVSWLTMARVIRGQVLSLKAQPFMEAARAMGVSWRGQFFRHLLPNLVGPIVVYTTLTVPQAILQESFLSFLGIGVKPPLPSWGNLAADGLPEMNPFKSYWWLLLFPCLLLATTLLALNFVGEGLREAFDPKRRGSRRG